MKIAIIGIKGMLGHDLASAARAAGHDVIGLDLPAFDITDRALVAGALPEVDLAVNCAAYTAVDAAETHRDLAQAVNAEGVMHVAQACAARGVRLFHLSTDYVFDGRGEVPYREEDPPHPLSVYGASKLEGERNVAAAGGNHLVVRVQSLFGRHGEHFIGKILRKLRAETGDLSVVQDQVSSPTYTAHLADALLRLAGTSGAGTVHVAASGSCSWYEFALEAARAFGFEERIRPVPSSAFPTPAPRPARSVLDTSRYQAWTGHGLPDWKQGLHDYLGEERASS